MGRSGYFEGDDEENLAGLWRASVDRAIHGKRGQAFLRELAAALDAMPVKELITDSIVRNDGGVCAIGAVAQARKVDVSKLDVECAEEVGKTFGIAKALAAEIAYQNDDDFGMHPGETPGRRWHRIRNWVEAQLLLDSKGTPKG